jgi:CheY-like chemotaxis protein
VAAYVGLHPGSESMFSLCALAGGSALSRYIHITGAMGLIVIVDDREDDCVLLERELRSQGVTNPITRFTDGEKALKFLKGDGIYANRTKHPLPCILMLDLKMPRVSGFDILEWLQVNPLPRKCLVLVVSELHTIGEINRAYHLGANSYLIKPSLPAELRECLKSFPQFKRLAEATAEQPA